MDSLFNETENAQKNYHMYRKVAKNLLTEAYLSDEEKASINEHLHDPMELKLALSTIFDKTIKKELNKMIVSHAESVFLTKWSIGRNCGFDH